LKYNAVATGGTFDHLHKGHLALLARSFEVGKRVVIGVTSDSFANKQGKHPDETYAERTRHLRDAINKNFPGKEYIIAKLDDYYGPGIASPEVEAIVVSRETAKRVPLANELRKSKGFQPLQVEVIDYVLADDFRPISSTRIRSGEIDTQGRLIKRSAENQASET
jgi:pantetheine-phosphate adenylyltransferase